MDRFKSAVILAGGKSTRMGFDKQLLSVNGLRLTERLILALSNIFGEIIIVTKTPEYYKDSGCILISDEIPDLGPLGGIHAALKRTSSQYAYFIACDMPNVNADYIEYMKHRLMMEETDACLTRKGDWIEPMNAFYSKSIIDKIGHDLLRGKGSIYYLLEKCKCTFIEEDDAKRFSPDWSMFLNLNTREDYEKYINMNKDAWNDKKMAQIRR
jgi:molybdopterin-guanine dinucleotide biosynthesis protein A